MTEKNHVINDNEHNGTQLRLYEQLNSWTHPTIMADCNYVLIVAI